MIKYGKQLIENDDVLAVIDVLNSEFLTQGPVTELFENEINNMLRSPFSLVLSNATNALHLAYVTLGLHPGDLLWTSSITFVATANAARQCGAEVDFVDISLDTFNICPVKLEQKLNKARQIPKILTVVHLGGSPCDLSKIKDICNHYKILLVEDASHALGASYSSDPIGSCVYSDACIFSLHPVKIITSGEGGILTFKNKEYMNVARMLASHGLERDSRKFKSKKSLDWYYEQQSLGYNYRMSEIQAALGLSQLKKLSRFVERRNTISSIYDVCLNDKLTEKQIHKQVIDDYSVSSYHLKIVMVPEKKRDVILQAFKKADVFTTLHYFPVHLQYYYQQLRNYSSLENSEYYSRNALTLPIHPTLTDQNICDISNILLDNIK